MENPKPLLAIVEFLEHAKLSTRYQQLGYQVTTENQVRKALTALRKIKPEVIVADFYSQPDFRDRVSNLESLLAVAQTLPQTKILVLYEAPNQVALERVRQRFHIDVALPMPVKEAELFNTLQGWLDT